MMNIINPWKILMDQVTLIFLLTTNIINLYMNFNKVDNAKNKALQWFEDNRVRSIK